MRKFLAALLAVMMIAGVLAALPISAAEPTRSSFDGTTSAEPLNDLIITEMLINSKSGTDRDDQMSSGNAAVLSSPDAFDYIEVYNNGDRPVNIYEYAIASVYYRDFTGKSSVSGGSVTAKPYMFTMKNILFNGSIHDTSATGGNAKSDPKTYDNSCQNPSNGYIEPGHFAIIWFWTTQTDTACADKGYSVGGTVQGDTRTFPHFRDHYGMDSETQIFVTNAKVSNGQQDLYQSLEYNWLYALVKKDYDFAQPAIRGTGENLRLDDKVVCMAALTQYNRTGFVTSDNMDNVSAYFVPAACTPDIRNINDKNVFDSLPKEEQEKDPFTPSTNYVDIGCALGYRETAPISFTEEPTPGGMPSWQWRYVEPDSLSDEDSETDDFGVEYIHNMAWKRATELVATLTDPANDKQKFPGITGIPGREIGNRDMNEEEKAAKTLQLYNQLLDCYISDWLIMSPTDESVKVVNTKLQDPETKQFLLTKTEGTYNWLAKADECMKELHVVTVNNEGNTGYEEDKKNYEDGFVNREDQMDKWFGSGAININNGNKLPVWALVLIIVGGVLLVGGAVVVVIIVIKKKNKPVAADDVAAEGEILVIDETSEGADEATTEETPAEEAAGEAPAEESAPADDENK